MSAHNWSPTDLRADLANGSLRIVQDGLRWRWSATVQSGTTLLTATGYAASQDEARGEAERVHQGLARLLR